MCELRRSELLDGFGEWLMALTEVHRRAEDECADGFDGSAVKG